MTTNSLQDLLNSYREAARTERDKGTYFERLSIAYLIRRHRFALSLSVPTRKLAKSRGVLLDWLKADAGEHTCRILTNARCLSEGVDVPALDAIMFLHPRKSQIDVVQSVGRVMRKTDTKKMGYPLEFFQRVITVSLETMKIVRSLPKLDIDG